MVHIGRMIVTRNQANINTSVIPKPTLSKKSPRLVQITYRRSSDVNNANLAESLPLRKISDAPPRSNMGRSRRLSRMNANSVTLTKQRRSSSTNARPPPPKIEETRPRWTTQEMTEM